METAAWGCCSENEDIAVLVVGRRGIESRPCSIPDRRKIRHDALGPFEHQVKRLALTHMVDERPSLRCDRHGDGHRGRHSSLAGLDENRQRMREQASRSLIILRRSSLERKVGPCAAQSPLLHAGEAQINEETKTCIAIPITRPSSGITNHDPDAAFSDRPIQATTRWRIAVHVLDVFRHPTERCHPNDQKRCRSRDPSPWAVAFARVTRRHRPHGDQLRQKPKTKLDPATRPENIPSCHGRRGRV